ncbi:hypothetical protein BDP27DRAFT_1212111 [Rhodocollybia butyracea]|uniref:Uncharacterized protein n=1 Tax=Rhodocollybia butyracea TaxID=206335 RepID=A0A9P5Q7A6_9AGAR|nr:hypothetical protein BDP27DRAFT_1212111 [Rhodocollybia butyracea]
MCYPEGSVSQAVNVCPMCKVFPHSRCVINKCPHVREVCRNRTLHPQLDALYLKNAEVDWFNGCGYCKWARSNASQKSSGTVNPGWPGCCRPPAQSEYRMIQAADWRSVSIVHHIPIPPEIKTILDGLTIGSRPRAPLPTSKGSPDSRSSTLPTSKVTVSIPERRRSNTTTGPAPPPKTLTPVRSTIASVTRSTTKKDDSLSSASSSGGGSDSLSDSTVTSDGGFTDYLSDESEAELQRQAEARAALLAQNQAEELEFKAARQQLAHVDLRPPKSWNPTNITNSTAPRLANTTTKA